MDPIRINLATYYYFNKRLANLIMILIGLLLVVLSGYMVHLGMKNQDEIREYERKIDWLERNIAQRLRERIAKVEMVVIEPKEMELLRREASNFNVLISKDVFPWCRILTTIEEILPGGLLLDHLSHSESYEKFTLKGTSDSMEAVTGFVTKLDASDLFEKSLLHKFNMEQTSDKTKSQANTQTVVFEIETQLDLKAVFPEHTYDKIGDTFIQAAKATQSSSK